MSERIQTDDLVREKDARTDEAHADERRADEARADTSRRDKEKEKASAGQPPADVAGPDEGVRKKARSGEAGGDARADEDRPKRERGDGARASRDREAGTDGNGALPELYDERRAESLRDRWQDLQGRFVDEPRETVEEADALVAEMLQELARGFADARSGLESQWSSGDDVSTEELRVTLRRYRAFFERLLVA